MKQPGGGYKPEHNSNPTEPPQGGSVLRPLTTDDEDRLISKVNEAQSESLERDEATLETIGALMENFRRLMEKVDEHEKEIRRLKNRKPKKPPAPKYLADILQVASRNTAAIADVQAKVKDQGEIFEVHTHDPTHGGPI